MVVKYNKVLVILSTINRRGKVLELNTLLLLRVDPGGTNILFALSIHIVFYRYCFVNLIRPFPYLCIGAIVKEREKSSEADWDRDQNIIKTKSDNKFEYVHIYHAFMLSYSFTFSLQ